MFSIKDTNCRDRRSTRRDGCVATSSTGSMTCMLLIWGMQRQCQAHAAICAMYTAHRRTFPTVKPVKPAITPWTALYASSAHSMESLGFAGTLRMMYVGSRYCKGTKRCKLRRLQHRDNKHNTIP